MKGTLMFNNAQKLRALLEMTLCLMLLVAVEMFTKPSVSATESEGIYVVSALAEIDGMLKVVHLKRDRAGVWSTSGDMPPLDNLQDYVVYGLATGNMYIKVSDGDAVVVNAS